MLNHDPDLAVAGEEVILMEERKQTLDELEEQVKRELNIKDIGPNMTTEEAGRLGGYMVKHLIERGEKAAGGRKGEEHMHGK